MTQENGQKGWITAALGLFSVALGAAQVGAPGAVARLIGVRPNDDNEKVLRLVGARELASAVGIFAQPKPAPWLWARVAGDAMDLALLGLALNARRTKRQRTTIALAAVAGITALDLVHSLSLTRDGAQAKGMEMKRAITVDRSPEELYRFWRDFGNLPRFMSHLQSVQVTGDRRSHWKTSAPLGKTVEWDAEITDDRPNEMIAWRSLPGADVKNEGVVHFVSAPGGRGTEVRVEMRYNLPGGRIGKTIAALFEESPERQVYDDLRSLKQIIETGEVLYSDSSIHGHPHPAQPPVGNPRPQGVNA